MPPKVSAYFSPVRSAPAIHHGKAPVGILPPGSQGEHGPGGLYQLLAM